MDVIAAPTAAASAPPPGKMPAGAGDAFAAVLARAALSGGETRPATPEADATEVAPVPAGLATTPPAPDLAPAAAQTPTITDVDPTAANAAAIPAPGMPEADGQPAPGTTDDGPSPCEAAPKASEEEAATTMALPSPEAMVAAPPPPPAAPAAPLDAVPAAQPPVPRDGRQGGEIAAAAPPQARPMQAGQAAPPVEAADATPPPTAGEAPARPFAPRRTPPKPVSLTQDGPPPAAAAQPEVTATMPRLPPALEPPAAHERLAPPSPVPARAATDPASAPVADASLAAPAKAAVDAAQPPPARPVAPTAPPARQIAPVVVAVAIGGGTARLAVTLEPGELGRVEISVERSGDTAQVQILAERPETLAVLQRDQRELDRALSQAGIASEGRAVSLGLASDGGGGEQAWQDRRDARPDPRRAADIPAPAAEPRRAVLSLLDLAV